MTIDIRQLSMPEVLLRVAEGPANDKGLRFLEDGKESEDFVSYQDFALEVANFAGALAASGLFRSDRVLLVLPDNYQFSVAFLAALHGGFVAIPTAPPLTASLALIFAEHVKRISAISKPTLLVTSPELKPVLAQALGGSVQTILTFTELQAHRQLLPFVAPDAQDLAFLQFTSGSTAEPRGVGVQFGNLSANIHGMTLAGLKASSESDVFVSWLPLHHDMGLIAMFLTALASQCSAVLLPSMLFLKRPVEWFRAISTYRGTITFAPNFAYGLCVKRIKDRELAGLDLSCLRVSGCAAEPINAQTLRDFAAKFEPIGFPMRSISPCYGLAESTVAVSRVEHNSGPRADVIDRRLMTTIGKAVPVSNLDSNSVEVICCGRSFPEHDIAIFDDSGNFCAQREIGEIVLHGPSVMQGYYNNQAATDEVLRNGWLHTGDMGYLVDEELYVCGRKKEMIIIAGCNYYPTDIEWVISDVSGVRKGNVIAFGYQDLVQDSERVVACVETHLTKKHLLALSSEIKARVLEHLGIQLHQVVLLNPSSLPKTSSGKLQRGKAKQLFLDGNLRSKSKHWRKVLLIRHLAASWRGQIAMLFSRP